MKWEGRIVGMAHNCEQFPDRVICLIETDDGDRIWRFEDELDYAPGVLKGLMSATQGT